MPALCSELLGAVINWLLNLLQDDFLLFFFGGESYFF